MNCEGGEPEQKGGSQLRRWPTSLCRIFQTANSTSIRDIRDERTVYTCGLGIVADTTVGVTP